MAWVLVLIFSAGPNKVMALMKLLRNHSSEWHRDLVRERS